MPDAAPSRVRGALPIAAAAAVVVAAVGVIYRDAAASYFFNDGFQWLQDARRFDIANIVRLERYDHFYRPVVEIYFYLGRKAFACEAFPFHLASIGIHLLNTLLLFLIARRLIGNEIAGAAAALLFAVQPGYVEAVAWVAAITDLLPALWYLLALWLHLRFLENGRASAYAMTLVAFVTCLLTHESSATLLPMLILLEVTVRVSGGTRLADLPVRRGIARYLPFALALTGSLTIAFVVNSRSYLVREGAYRFGWHALPHMFHYVVALFVGKRNLLSYVLIAASVTLLLARGTPRTRFYTAWIFVTLAPASFFTWGIASRYLYLPAAGFALLLASLLYTAFERAGRYLPARTRQVAAAAVVAALAVRFGVFATKGSADFRERTRPYERYVAALRAMNRAPRAGDTVYVRAADTENVPELYRDAAAEAAFCTADLHVEIR